MDAKVKASRCQPLLAWHWDLTRELARARPRAYPVLKVTGTLISKNVCTIV